MILVVREEAPLGVHLRKLQYLYVSLENFVSFTVTSTALLIADALSLFTNERLSWVLKAPVFRAAFLEAVK